MGYVIGNQWSGMYMHKQDSCEKYYLSSLVNNLGCVFCKYEASLRCLLTISEFSGLEGLCISVLYVWSVFVFFHNDL